jgi:manganese transport protein
MGGDAGLHQPSSTRIARASAPPSTWTSSAKLGIATGKNLAELCRERFSFPTSIGLWIQAELVAMACDIAEVVDRQPFDGPLFVRVGGKVHALGTVLARAMRVEAA